MRRAMSVMLIVIVFSAGLGLVVQSTLRGQGAAVLSTPRPAASKSENPFEGPEDRRPRPAAGPAEQNPFEEAGTSRAPASNRPATRSGPPAGYMSPGSGYAGAGTSGMMARIPEAWQAQQEIPGLLAKYAQTSDEKERAKLKDGLAKVLEKLFDLQQKERENEIADIEGRVKRLRDMLDKRTKARQSIITSRLEQLVREAEGLGWVDPTASGPPGMMMGGSGIMPMPRGASGMYPSTMGGGSGGGGMGGYGGPGMRSGGSMGAYRPVQATPAAPPKAPSDAAKPAEPTTFKKKRSGSSGSGSKSSSNY